MTKHILFNSILFLAIGFSLSAQDKPALPTLLPIGAQAPDFKLQNVDDRWYSLSDYAESDVLAVVFLCNHCPTAQAYEDRLIQLVKDYQDQSFQLIAISPNAPDAVMLNELGYSDLGDSFEEMKVRVEEKGYNFPYLYDGDTQETSRAFGAVATPHLFVFNKDRKLTYAGRIDASEKPGSAHAEDARHAIEKTLSNESLAVPVTKTFGCSVKWDFKAGWKKQLDERWAKKEVTVSPIDLVELKALMKNPSDKLYVINVWATWCGPCIAEFPDLVDMSRMYYNRDFEFISVSTDPLSKKDKVLSFHQDQNNPNTNYITSFDDKYALIEAIDPEWQGALPHTVVVEPGGKIVYRSQGIVDLYQLKKAIVDSPTIGRYY